jgi:hypothetical protein
MWPGEVAGDRVVGDGRQHGGRAVLGRDAGADAVAGLDGDREGGAQAGLVVADHHRQLELVDERVVHGQADEAAGVGRHEVDRLGRHLLGGEHEVALVLAILVVDEDDHAAGADVGEGALDAGDRVVGDHGRAPLRQRSPAGR